MNHYRLEDIRLGMKESFSVQITENVQKMFTELSGDVNPMHLNKDICISGGYRDKLVYGMATASAKYALLGLIRAAASEYAGRGITINGLSPNMMETKFLANLDERSIEMNREASAMKRNISLDEVCAALEYLLSAQAGYVNGINMNLSGGDRM